MTFWRKRIQVSYVIKLANDATTDGSSAVWASVSSGLGTSRIEVRRCWAIFANPSVLPLEFKPAYSAGVLLIQHLDALEQEAEEKGGVQHLLADHFSNVYKVSPPLAA